MKKKYSVVENAVTGVQIDEATRKEVENTPDLESLPVDSDSLRVVQTEGEGGESE